MELYVRRCRLLASLLVLLAQGLALAEAQSSNSTSLGPGVDSRTTGNATGIWPWQEFVTVDYNPPLLEIEANGEKLAPGYVFIAPSDANASLPSTKQSGAPIILTDTGDLVWNGPAGIITTNFRAQTLFNKTVLTYWQGDPTSATFVGHGYGSVTILDDTYTQILSVCPKISINIVPAGTYSCVNDLHESKITERNTILLTAYNLTQTDLSSVGGPTDGFIYDALVFEVALDGSNKVLFQWSSIEHVPVNQSHLPLAGAGTNSSTPYDYFHINAIDLVGDSYLVNSRHTWSTYLVKSSGEVAWTVNGDTGGDFGSLPPGGNFRWQHDARHHHVSDSSITISWYNNYNGEAPTAPNATNANGTVVIAIRFSLPPNPQNPPVLVNHVTNEPPIYDASQGSYTYWLPGDSPSDTAHQFVGFGQIPLVREYNARPFGSGGLLWSARFGVDNLVQSYRGLKFVWQATPRTTPTLVVKPGVNATSLGNGYVSWNGATQVTSYNVYEGATNVSLSLIGSIQKAGFETSFGVSQQYVQVAAVVGSAEVSRSEVVSA